MAEGRSYWRIVRANPATSRDFMSHVALGLPVRRLGPDALRQAQGISVFATESQARRQARRYPILGHWLVELSIGGELDLIVERTPGGAGHHTIWAEPEQLLGQVIRTVPV